MNNNLYIITVIYFSFMYIKSTVFDKPFYSSIKFEVDMRERHSDLFGKFILLYRYSSIITIRIV